MAFKGLLVRAYKSLLDLVRLMRPYWALHRLIIKPCRPLYGLVGLVWAISFHFMLGFTRPGCP